MQQVELLHSSSEQKIQGAQARMANTFECIHDQRLTGDGENRRHGVDRKRGIACFHHDQRQQQWRRKQLPWNRVKNLGPSKSDVTGTILRRRRPVSSLPPASLDGAAIMRMPVSTRKPPIDSHPRVLEQRRAERDENSAKQPARPGCRRKERDGGSAAGQRNG